MILRAAIVLLLMLNLGAAAWWWLGEAGASAGPRAAAAEASGAPRLRLVSEAAPPRAGRSPAPAPNVAVVSSLPAASGEPSVSQSPASNEQCLRFGPFTNAAARDAARPALAALASNVVAREIPGRASRGWWVFVPALPSRDEALALGEQVEAAGISDWYVMNDGDQANSISLGRYGSEDAARRRETDLRAKGFAAQAAPLVNRAPQWWLDARMADRVSAPALAAISPSNEIACTGLR